MNLERIINTDEEAVKYLKSRDNDIIRQIMAYVSKPNKYQYTFHAMYNKEDLTQIYMEMFLKYILSEGYEKDGEYKLYAYSMKNFKTVLPSLSSEVEHRYLANYYMSVHPAIFMKTLEEARKQNTFKEYEINDCDLQVDESGNTILDNAEKSYISNDEDLSVIISFLTRTDFHSIGSQFLPLLNEQDASILKFLIYDDDTSKLIYKLNISRKVLSTRLQDISFRFLFFMQYGTYKLFMNNKIKIDNEEFMNLIYSDKYKAVRTKYKVQEEISEEIIDAVINGKGSRRILVVDFPEEVEKVIKEVKVAPTFEEVQNAVYNFDKKAKLFNKNAFGVNNPMYRLKVDINGKRHNHIVAVVNCYGWLYDYNEKTTKNLLATA